MRKVLRYVSAAVVAGSLVYLIPRGLSGNLNYEGLARQGLETVEDIADTAFGIVLLLGSVGVGVSFLNRNGERSVYTLRTSLYRGEVDTNLLKKSLHQGASQRPEHFGGTSARQSAQVVHY